MSIDKIKEIKFLLDDIRSIIHTFCKGEYLEELIEDDIKKIKNIIGEEK